MRRNIDGQFTLGNLIEILGKMPKNKELVIACDASDAVFKHQLDGGKFAYPNSIDSWRGIYAELAIGYGPFPGTVGEFLPKLIKANGQTFGGWKGGEYVMDLDTLLWVDEPGECNNMAVVGVNNDKRVAIVYDVRKAWV